MSWEKAELEARVNPDDYTWIKVKRHADDPSCPLEERYTTLEAHHKAETNFLINEVRALAVALKVSWTEIEKRGACEHRYTGRERRDGQLVDVCFKCSGAKPVVEKH